MIDNVLFFTLYFIYKENFEDFYLHTFILFRIYICLCDLLLASFKFMGALADSHFIVLLTFFIIIQYFTLFIRIFFISDDG